MTSISFYTDDFYHMVFPFLGYDGVSRLGNASNAVGYKTYQLFIKNQIKDPRIRAKKNNDQMQMARQTYKIIINSHLKIEKKYVCLKALSAALIFQCSPGTYHIFRRIALADIPHFISTRCWQVEMRWKESHHFKTPIFQTDYYSPMTEKSLSAFIQAHKNFLTCSIEVDDGVKTACIPSVIFTEGNRPKLGLMKNENTKTAFDKLKWGTYFEMYWKKIISGEFDFRHGVCNIRYVTEEETRQTAAAINKDVAVRNRYSSCLNYD